MCWGAGGASLCPATATMQVKISDSETSAKPRGPGESNQNQSRPMEGKRVQGCEEKGKDVADSTPS